VTVDLADPPPDLHLLMGTDARVLPHGRSFVTAGGKRRGRTRTGLWTLSLAGPRAHQTTMAAAAVALAVPIGCAMNLPVVWWAAISAVISTMPTPVSVEKGLLRPAGTAVGASLADAPIGRIAYDTWHPAWRWFAVSSIALLGMAKSRHGDAWKFLGVTFTLVALVSLNDPAQAFSLAIYRTLEVWVGITCATLVATLLAPDATRSAPRHFTCAASPRWLPPWRL